MRDDWSIDVTLPCRINYTRGSGEDEGVLEVKGDRVKEDLEVVIIFTDTGISVVDKDSISSHTYEKEKERAEKYDDHFVREVPVRDFIQHMALLAGSKKEVKPPK